MTAVAPRRAPDASPAATGHSWPPLIEVIGAAGTGKTTLVRAVVSQLAGARRGLRLHRARDLPAVARAAAQVAPALLVDGLHRSATAAHDARYTLRLLAHQSPAVRALASAARVVLIDEGPVYMLARLLAFGSVSSERSGFRRHWERSVEWWRQRLDAIVWLDAPNDVLAARIRGRGKNHRAKHTSDTVLSEFLLRYRAAYATVVERLTIPHGPRVIRLDSRRPLDTEVDHLVDALTLAPWPRVPADR